MENKPNVGEEKHDIEKTGRIGRIRYVILPVCLFAFLLFFSVMQLFRIDNSTQLNGVTLAPMPTVTGSSLMDGTWQKNWGDWLSDNFFGHTDSVKMCNQILYSVFRDGNGDWCVGAGHSLISRNDSLQIAAPGIFVDPQERYDEYAQSVYKLQTSLERNGKSFVYLITPTKADIYPDALPWNYKLIQKRNGNDALSRRERMIAAFEKYGVNYYDLTDDFLRMRETADFEVFPKTGYHWTLTAVANEMNPLFEKLSAMTPGIDYPEVNVVGSTNDVFYGDKDLYNALNVYSVEESDEYISPIVECPRTSSDKVYYVGTSMGNAIYNVLTAYSADLAFERWTFQQYSTVQASRSSEGETQQLFQETDPPEALHIMEHIQDSDLIIMEQSSLFGPGLHDKFLNYVNEHIDKLFYHPGDDLVTDYENMPGVSWSGDYGLEGGEWRWMGKNCEVSVYGDELKNAGKNIKLSISMNSFHADQSVRIIVNDREIAVCRATPSVSVSEVTIPADIIEPEVNTIKLSMQGEPYSPYEIEALEDVRRLGVSYDSVILEVSE